MTKIAILRLEGVDLIDVISCARIDVESMLIHKFAFFFCQACIFYTLISQLVIEFQE